MDAAHYSSQSVSDIFSDQNSGKKEFLTGCHRTVPPAETLVRLSGLKERMGITRVADVTGLDRIGIPVVMVCRPNARSLAVSQGKGLDLTAATVSGLMEAAELYHAEHIRLPLKLGSYADLAGSHRLVEAQRLARIYPDSFHADLRMLWIEGVDLMSGEVTLVPLETVRADFTIPAPTGSGCFDCSSNGLASGNTLAEAACHAICEVIERDATALLNRKPVGERNSSGVDPGSVDDEPCLQILEKLDQADFDVAVWETTSDIGVPTFFALISDRQDTRNHRGIGAGCHPARNIALLRALTEAVQVRTTYISGARDDLSPDEYRDDSKLKKSLETARFMSGHLPERNFRSVPHRMHPTFAGDLNWLLERLRSVGITEAVMVDLGIKELGLSVVKVVIPGLEGPDDHEGYLPGERARRLAGRAA